MVRHLGGKWIDIVLRTLQWFNQKTNALYSRMVKFQFRAVGHKTFFGKFNQLMGAGHIVVGSHTVIGEGCWLTAWESHGQGEVFNPEINIGDNVNIGAYCHITSTNKILIGNGVLTGKWVTITDNSHGDITFDNLNLRPNKRIVTSKGSVVIEDNVWIGDKATILPGCVIGKGAVIGAGAVVTHDIPEFGVAVGNPAKVIKKLNKKYEETSNSNKSSAVPSFSGK